MNNMMKKVIITFSSILLCILGFHITVSASETLNVIETFVSEDYTVIYTDQLKGDIQGAEGYIAAIPIESIDYKTLLDSGKEIKTVILIDSSLSIKIGEQEHFKEFLTKLIDSKRDNESFAIATYGEEADYIIDFTADRWELIKALDNIEYKKQNSYLIEILYDMVNTFNLAAEESFYRIVVFSDGDDTNQSGVTTNELYSQLQSSPYPIFTIGCEYDSNREDLKDFYSLSRITNIDSIAFTQDSDLDEMLKILNSVYDYMAFTIIPPKSVQDGGIKNLLLNIECSSGSFSASADVRMNMVTSDEGNNELIENEDEDVTETIESSEEQVTINSDNTSVKDMYGRTPTLKTDENPKRNLSIVFYLCIGIILIIVIIIVLLMVTGKKGKKKQVDDIDRIPLDTTVILSNTKSVNNRSANSQYLFASKQNFKIKLLDCSNNRVFEHVINDQLIIGRSTDCNIVIDYDLSISQTHCRMYINNGEVFVEDIKSSNHTYLNDIIINRGMKLNSGDFITLGRVRLQVTIGSL